jgi:hypothetical protein
MSEFVNVKLAEGSSYTTLTRSFRKGEVYRLPAREWDKLKSATHPVTGKAVFATTDDEHTAEQGESTERADVVKGGGITISHNPPKGMTPEQMDKAGLHAFAAHARRDSHPQDVDTGADMVGKAEAEDYQGPSGHDGLDDDDEVTVGEAPAPVSTAAPAPAPKGKVVVRPGPRNSALKDKLGGKPGDVVKV